MLWDRAVDAQHLRLSHVGDAAAVVVDPPGGLVEGGLAALILVKVEAVCKVISEVRCCLVCSHGIKALMCHCIMAPKVIPLKFDQMIPLNVTLTFTVHGHIL